MKRDKFFGFDATKKCAFVFLFENNQKRLSLFIEYENEENFEVVKQDLAIYGLFWDSGSIVEEMISLFNINPVFKKLSLKTWAEES